MAMAPNAAASERSDADAALRAGADATTAAGGEVRGSTGTTGPETGTQLTEEQATTAYALLLELANNENEVGLTFWRAFKAVPLDADRREILQEFWDLVAEIVTTVAKRDIPFPVSGG